MIPPFPSTAVGIQAGRASSASGQPQIVIGAHDEAKMSSEVYSELLNDCSVQAFASLPREHGVEHVDKVRVLDLAAHLDPFVVWHGQ